MGWFPSLGRHHRPKQPKPDIEAAAEETRIERGKLAVAISTLSLKRQDLEQLMIRMIEERHNV